MELGAQVEMSGCRAAALDAGHPDSLYVAGGGHNGASGWKASPPPLYTADGGKSWERIPAPAGFDQPGAFLGFLVAPDRVTAWFGRPESERLVAPAEIQGSATTDGGRTWSTISLACPAVAPCAWDLPASLFLQGYRGLRFSADGGKTWQWVGLPAPTNGWPREMEIGLEPDGSLTGRFDQSRHA